MLKGGGATDEGCDGHVSPLPCRAAGCFEVTSWGHQCTDGIGGTFVADVDRQTAQLQLTVIINPRDINSVSADGNEVYLSPDQIQEFS